MDIERRLLDRRWRWVTTRAAVAVVLREGVRGEEVLLMERSRRPGDPWSGHVSLPGGFAEPGDADDHATAVRETAEELGIDLSDAPVLGHLCATLAWTPRDGGRAFAIVPIVFRWEGRATLDLSHEARDAFWVPLEALRDPAHRARRPWKLLGVRWPMPAWDWDGRVIWGLTRRLLLDLLQRL